MPSNHTENYSLNQWEKSDKVLMEDFNADNLKIDAALAGLAAKDKALEAILAGKGNCRVEAFSYTGTSEDNDGLTNVLRFSARPHFVLAMGYRAVLLMPGLSQTATFIGTYEALNGNDTIMPSEFTWSGSNAHLTSPSSIVRMNRKGTAYQIIAWIPLS